MTTNDPSGAAPETTSLQSLRNGRNFRRVLREGARFRQGGIVVAGSPGPADTPRLGLVVSKQCGSAVTRNRIKRRLRHAAQGLRLQPGMDYVIIASEQVAEAPFSQLQGWLQRAVERLHHD